MFVATEQSVIVVIEDNLLNLDMACELLEIAGYKTFPAEDAATGIELARQVKPDLILMDLHMPQFDGFMATRAIKADPALQHIPIVAFTALAMRDDQEKAIASGCSGLICKPIDVNRFAESIQSYINHEHPIPFDVAPIAPGYASPHLQKRMAMPPVCAQSPETMRDSAGNPMLPHLDIAPHTILGVDDNPMNVELLKDALESMGQNVHPTYSGREALAWVTSALPDLILLDIMMPEMDGYEVLDRLKANPLTMGIPVIFISALNKTQDMVRGFQHGTYDYITKPFKVEEVKARIYASLRIKDLQDSLKNEKDKLGAIFRFSADAIALLTPSYQVVSANPRFGQWFHIPLTPEGQPVEPAHFIDLLNKHAPESAAMLNPAEVSLMPPTVPSDEMADTDMESDKQILENAILASDSHGLRYVNIHAGQVSTVVSLGPQGYVVVLRDVTKEKTIEQSKETFVATLTHDLKTPIRAEYQALELLRSESFGPLSAEQQEILKEIIQSNRYMYRLVDSLLSTYMYEEGRITLNFEAFSPNTLIEKELMPTFKILAKEKNQTVCLALDPALKTMEADAFELQRVLNNLGQNAINYTPEGGTITVKTHLEGDKVRFSVCDTGPGLDEKAREAVFGRYMSMAKKFNQVGTGLGLYLSRRIVEAHGGEIGVDSEPGHGSRFYFIIPLKPVDPAAGKAMA